MTNGGTIIRLFLSLPSSSPSLSASLPPSVLPWVVLWLLPSGLLALSSDPGLIGSSHPVGTMGLLQIWLPCSKNLIHLLLVRLGLSSLSSPQTLLYSHSFQGQASGPFVQLPLLESEGRYASPPQALRGPGSGPQTDREHLQSPLPYESPVPGCPCPAAQLVCDLTTAHHCSRHGDAFLMF